jgi:hypothetical protein
MAVAAAPEAAATAGGERAMTAREQEAGQLYTDGRRAIRNGGHDLHSVAMHLILMVKGTADHPGALWPVRELNNGDVVRLDRFIDYLLRPAREGLGLPTLHFLKRVLLATIPAADGERALKLVRDELRKEHVDLDEHARRDEMRMQGTRPALAEHGEIGRGRDRGDNITSEERGTSSAYLAAKLRRDHPEIADRMARGEFRSVRAAAIAAGIVRQTTALDQLRRAWRRASSEQQEEFLAENHCRREQQAESAP